MLNIRIGIQGWLRLEVVNYIKALQLRILLFIFLYTRESTYWSTGRKKVLDDMVLLSKEWVRKNNLSKRRLRKQWQTKKDPKVKTKLIKTIKELRDFIKTRIEQLLWKVTKNIIIHSCLLLQYEEIHKTETVKNLN